MTRSFSGELLDVTTAAGLLGTTPKGVRARIARRTIPFKKLGGRLVLLRHELETFIENLDGCSVDEARSNLENRTPHKGAA
jgi:hypothetical protein